MSWEEFLVWRAFNRIEPLPDPWVMFATLAAQQHNAWFRGRPKRPADYIPSWKARREQTVEEQMGIMDGITRRAKVARHG